MYAVPREFAIVLVHRKSVSEEKDKRRLRKSDLQISVKEKTHRQGKQMRRTRREDALREADGDTYEPGGFLSD